MGLTMNKIIDKYSDGDMFSLTGRVWGYSVSEEEFINAINKMEEVIKTNKRKEYKKNKNELMNYPEFEIMYEEIKQECIDYDNEVNRENYFNKFFDNKMIENCKKMGIPVEDILKNKDFFFKSSFIAD